jgi:hypothetical protein
MTLANLNQIDENFSEAESAERRIEKLTKINRASNVPWSSRRTRRRFSR